ncbi:MAG: 50S ribosomal protein L24 [Thermodesulfobacteriota bacterium]
MKAGRNYLKLNDKVEVIAGKDKGRVGKVIKMYPLENRAKVERINIAKRHLKPNQQNQQGGIIDMEMPIHVSNLMLICPGCAQTVRIKKHLLGDGTKARVCIKCGETVEPGS